MRSKLLIAIFVLSTLLILWVFFFIGTTYRRPYERPYKGCGANGCGVP